MNLEEFKLNDPSAEKQMIIPPKEIAKKVSVHSLTSIEELEKYLSQSYNFNSKLIEGNRAPEGLFFGRLSAVSTAAVGPIVVLGWFCQKQLVKGLTFGAVK